MLARLVLLHKLDARFITCQCSLMGSRMCWFCICCQLSRQKVSTNEITDHSVITMIILIIIDRLNHF